MSRENVTWISASVVPMAWVNGPVNSVQTYCGLEIAIMAISPRTSWSQRLVDVDATLMALFPPGVYRPVFYRPVFYRLKRKPPPDVQRGLVFSLVGRSGDQTL